MAEFKQGTEAEVKSGAAQFRAGAIVSEQSRTFIGRETFTPTTGRNTGTAYVVNPGTSIYHRAVTYVTQDDQGKVNGSERVIYIEKNGTWQPAAISKDGGKTYSFSDPNYPTMDGVAGAGFQNEINDPQGAVHKNLDAQVNRSLRDSGVPVTQRKEVVESIRNNADQQPLPDSTDGSTDGTTPPKPLEELEKPSGRTNYAQKLIYPIDLSETYQDYLQIQMVEYVPRGLSNSTVNGEDSLVSERRGNTAKDRNILSSIYLPVTGGISDSNRVNWSDSKMDFLTQQIQNFAYNAAAEGPGGAKSSVESTVKGAQNNKEALKQTVLSKLLGQDAYARQFGAVLNENTELLFNGIQLRSFSFQYKFSPRSVEEKNQVTQIIRTLKQGMSAKTSNNFTFLRSPHTFYLTYYHNNKPHNYLNKFKECALTDLSVSYTPDGNYATYYDGSMVSYQVTMNFQELEPVLDSDYESDNDVSIGY